MRSIHAPLRRAGCPSPQSSHAQNVVPNGINLVRLPTFFTTPVRNGRDKIRERNWLATADSDGEMAESGRRFQMKSFKLSGSSGGDGCAAITCSTASHTETASLQKHGLLFVCLLMPRLGVPAAQMHGDLPR